MSVKVVTAKVEAKVGGETLPVCGFTIDTAVNAIPAIELMCAPSKAGKFGNNVESPTLADYSDLYRSLGEKSYSLNVTGDVSIRLEASDGDINFLNLKNWILSGAGMSNVSATGAPYLSVILQHPICKLTKIGSVYETPKANIGIDLNVDAGKENDPVKIMKQVYDYLKNADDKFEKSNSNLAISFRKKLGEGEFDPGRYLHYKGSKGLFLSQHSSNERIAQAIGRYIVAVSTGSSSTWDILQGMAGTLLLSITQDNEHNLSTDKLILEPTQPWKKASLTLYDTDCASTDLPGADTFRLSGVMSDKLGPFNEVSTSQGLVRNISFDDKDMPASEVLYVPQDLDVASASGRIMKVSAPKIIESAYRRDAPYGEEINGLAIEDDKGRLTHYTEALNQYCKAVYEISALSMSNATAQMAMRFWDGKNGAPLLPGNTCEFKSGKKTLYYGYIRRIVHKMSTDGGCGTTIYMSYVRPQADLKIGGKTVVSAGAGNPAYE